MSRLLAPAEFGEVQVLISLFLQITIFLTVLGLVTINVVANYRDPDSRNAVVLEFEKLAFLLSGVVLAMAVLFHKQLEYLLQFESSTPFILLVIALVATVPLVFRGAFLRGRQQFGTVSAANIVAAGGKLLFSVVFVVLGYTIHGAMGGLICAQLVASFFAISKARRAGLGRAADQPMFRLPKLRMLRPELPYGLLVLAGSLIITLQYSLDVLVVKHFFDPETAGLYAGVASVARIIFFLTASVALVLMPMVRLQNPAAENRRLLVKSFVLCAAIGLPVLALCVLVPHGVVSLLMGREFATAATLLPRLGLTVFIVSMLNVLVTYYLALRRYAMLPIVLLGGGTTYVLLLINHSSLSAVVNSLLMGSLAMLALFALWRGGAKAKEYV